MKRKRLILLLILILLFLVSCQKEAQPLAPTSQPPPEENPSLQTSNEVPSEANIIIKEYTTSLTHYFTAPVLSGDLLLAISTFNSTNTQAPETIIYNIKTHKEENTHISTLRLQLRDDTFYYFEHSSDLQAASTLIKQSHTTGEKTVLYTAADGFRVLGLELSDKYLSWNEVADREVTLVLSQGGVIDGTYYDLVVFDVEREEEIYRVKNMLSYTPYVAPKLYENHLLIRSYLEGGNSKISLIDFLEDKVLYERQIESIPFFFDYDNGLLTYSLLEEGLYIIDTNKDAVIYELKGSFSDAYVFDRRYFVYATLYQTCIRDLLLDKIIYDSDVDNFDDQNERKMHCGGSYYVQRETKEIVIRKKDRSVENGYSIVIIKIE